MAWDDDAEAGIDKAESAAGTELKRTVVAPIRAVVAPIEEKAKDLWSRLWNGLLHGIGIALKEIGDFFGWESWVKIGQQLESIGRDQATTNSRTGTPSVPGLGAAPPVPGTDQVAPNTGAPQAGAGTGFLPATLLNKVESLGTGVVNRVEIHWQFYGLLFAAHTLPKVRTPLLWLEDNLILKPAGWVAGEIADPLLRKMGFVGFKDAARIEAVKDTIPVTFTDKRGPTVEREIVLKPTKVGALTRIKRLFPPTAIKTSEELSREAWDRNAAATNEKAAVVTNLTSKITASDVVAVKDNHGGAAAVKANPSNTPPDLPPAEAEAARNILESELTMEGLPLNSIPKDAADTILDRIGELNKNPDWDGGCGFGPDSRHSLADAITLARKANNRIPLVPNSRSSSNNKSDGEAGPTASAARRKPPTDSSGVAAVKFDDPDPQPPLSAAAKPNGLDTPQPSAAIRLNDPSAPLSPGLLATNKISSHGITYEPSPRSNDFDNATKQSPTTPGGRQALAGDNAGDSSGVVADTATVAEPKNSSLEPGSNATGTLMGIGIALQAAGTLLDPERSHLSTGDKAALVTQTAVGTGQAALEFAGPSFTNTTGGSTHWSGVGNDITGDLTGVGRSVGGLGVAGGGLGLYASAAGLKHSIESGNTTGIVLNSGNALSSTAFTIAGIAQLAGKTGFAADSTGVGVIIGVPIQVISLGFQTADYRNQSRAIDGDMKSVEADEAAGSNGRITGSYSYIPGLPLPPSPDEYLGLTTLLHDKGDGSHLAANPDYYAKNPSKMEKMARSYGDQFDETKALRQDVLSNLESGGKLEQAIEETFTDNRELNAQTLAKVEKQIALATAGRAALQELQWGPPDGSHPAGYAWRMQEYQDTVQALQQNLDSRHIAAKVEDYYRDQWAELGRLADFYKAIGSQRTIGQIEDELGILTSNDPAAIGQRAAVEKIKANGDAAIQQTRDEVRRQRSDELDKAQKELSAAQARLKKIPYHIRSGRGGTTINPAYAAAQRAALVLEQKVDQIHSEIQQKVDEQAAEVQIRLTIYFANELAKRNAAEEYDKIKGMKTQQERDTYFQKNADFITTAGLQDRQDLACVGFSTSRDELNRRTSLLGLPALEAPAAAPTVNNTAQAQAVAAIKPVITEIKTAVTALSPAEVFEKFRNAMGENNGIAQDTTPSSPPLTPKVGSNTDTGGASDTSKHLP